jgi:spoIIIJ-associated protein
MDSDHLPAEHSLQDYLPRIESLLQALIRHARFALAFSIQKGAGASDDSEAPEYVVNFSGPDADLLLEKNAAVLNAMEYVVLKAVRVEEEYFGKVSFDCQDWRQLRNEELRLTAQVAAERVIDTGDPFTLTPMSPRERRVIHLALKGHSQVLTRSEGMGAERKVVIMPASPPSRGMRR